MLLRLQSLLLLPCCLWGIFLCEKGRREADWFYFTVWSKSEYFRGIFNKSLWKLGHVIVSIHISPKMKFWWGGITWNNNERDSSFFPASEELPSLKARLPASSERLFRKWQNAQKGSLSLKKFVIVQLKYSCYIFPYLNLDPSWGFSHLIILPESLVFSIYI